MWCYRRILKVPYTAHVTNSAVLKRVSLEHANLLTTKQKRRMMYIGHVLRGSSGSELRDILIEQVQQKNVGKGRRKTFWFDEDWSLIENNENKNIKLTLLIRRAQKRRLWKQFIDSYCFVEPTLTKEDGASC